MNIIRSSYTGHPTTGATIFVAVYEHPEARRMRFSVSSRWETFRSFTTIEAATDWFETFIQEHADAR